MASACLALITCGLLMLAPGGSSAAPAKGFLGVTMMEASENGVAGIRLLDVMPDSAALKAGLQPGDLITAIDGQAYQDTNSFRQYVGDAGAGATLRLSVIRAGKAIKLSVLLHPWPEYDRAAAAKNPPRSSGGTIDLGGGTIRGNIDVVGDLLLTKSESTIVGNLDLRWTSVLDVEIDHRDEHASVRVEGKVALAGILYVHFANLQPALGDRFEIIRNAQSIKGRFGKVMLPPLPPGLRWQLVVDDIPRAHDLDRDGKHDVTLVVVEREKAE